MSDGDTRYRKEHEYEVAVENYTFIVKSYHLDTGAPTIYETLLSLVRSKVIRSLAEKKD